MISVLLPWVLGAAVAGSAVVLAWHLLSVRQPPELLLPTARFVPGADARAVARRPRPNDLLLLLLRVVAVLAIGAAFSGLRCAGGGAQYARLVYVDRQHSGGSLPAKGAALDSTTVADATGDTVGRWQRLDLQMDPGAALARAWSDVAVLLRTHPSIEQVELDVILPASVQSRRGWDVWRAQWPGPVQVIARDSTLSIAERSVVLRGAKPDDVVSSAIAVHLPLTPRRDSVGSIAATRSEVTIARSDSVRMPRDYAGVWVHWTDGPGLAHDTVAAVSAAGRTVVGPFVRRDRTVLAAGARSIAWWSDGEPAATSRTQGSACLVDVQVEVPAGSDVLLSPEAGGLIDAIVNACAPRGVASTSLVESPETATPLSDAVAAVPADLLRSRLTAPPPTTDTRWTWGFVALAGLALLLEWRVRQ